MIYDENPRISLEIWINSQSHKWGSVVTCIRCWLQEVLLKSVNFVLNKWPNSLYLLMLCYLLRGRELKKDPCQTVSLASFVSLQEKKTKYLQ